METKAFSLVLKNVSKINFKRKKKENKIKSKINNSFFFLTQVRVVPNYLGLKKIIISRKENPRKMKF